MTFDETVRNFDSVNRARSPASPMSNSWLPNVAQSTPTTFSTATICLPASRSPLTRGDAEGGRRNVVAAQGRDETWMLRRQRRAQPRHSRQPAGLAGLDRRDFVDVVEMEDRDRRAARAERGRRRASGALRGSRRLRVCREHEQDGSDRGREQTHAEL